MQLLIVFTLYFSFLLFCLQCTVSNMDLEYTFHLFMNNLDYFSSITCALLENLLTKAISS